MCPYGAIRAVKGAADPWMVESLDRLRYCNVNMETAIIGVSAAANCYRCQQAEEGALSVDPHQCVQSLVGLTGSHTKNEA